MFKFKKGDEVCITYGSAFGSPSVYMAAMVEGSTITACKETPNGNAYRLKHFAGWWAEENLVSKSRASKNFSWRDEGSEAITYTPEETKCDTGDSGAFWAFEIPGYAKCSNCERSFEALPTVFMFKENNKFCRMCGKAMEVRDED